MDNHPTRTVRVFVILLIVINASLAIYSTPITDHADASAYILLSKVLIGEAEADLASRSPLLSIIMAGFMLILSPPVTFKAVILFHYILVGITSFLVFLIFKPLFEDVRFPILIGLMFNLSLSTIYLANIIMTEILAAFLLVMSVYWLLKIDNKFNYQDMLILGLLVGLVSLASFNVVPIIVPFTLLFGYIVYRQNIPMVKWVYPFTVFIIPYALVVNLWCVYNYHNNGFYGLFPGNVDGVSRNITVASIRPENKVSEEYEPVLEIFLDARAKYLESLSTTTLKGSLYKLDKFNFLTDLYSGYIIYKIAQKELYEYFQIDRAQGTYDLNQALGGFYHEIVNQNKSFIWKYRFVSFFSGFRAGPTSLPAKYGNINTNILPNIIFMLYKIGIIMISLFVFFSFFIFVINTIKNKIRPNISLLIVFIIILSFWGINFYFVTEANANRYKFPAEPIIFGIFIYYVYEGLNWFKAKFNKTPLKGEYT